METLIVQPKNKEQLVALKAIMKALKWISVLIKVQKAHIAPSLRPRLKKVKKT